MGEISGNVGVFAKDLDRGSAEGDEALDELVRKKVDVIRPTVVPEIPDHLHIGIAGGGEHWPDAGEIVFARAGFYQVPAQAVADAVDAVALHEPVIACHEGVVPGGGDEVEAFASGKPVLRALESSHEEAFEKIGVHSVRVFVGS